MKKHSLLLIALALSFSTVDAAASEQRTNDRDLNYRYAQPVMFMEQGIEFFIFSDGSFDYNTEYLVAEPYTNRRASTRYKRSSHRIGSNHPQSTAVSYSARRPRGPVITTDRFGTILAIGNVLVDYDRQGRIIRAGSVRMDYQRGNERLKRVGGLKVNYNHWGEIVHFKGQVNQYNIGMTNLYARSGHKYSRNKDKNTFKDGYHYYKKDGKVKKIKKVKAITK